MSKISKIKVDGVSHEVEAKTLDLGDTQDVPYSSLSINENEARFGDDEYARYLPSFYVAADDITIYNNNGISLRNSAGDHDINISTDYDLKLNGEKIATQDWVLENAGGGGGDLPSDASFNSIHVGGFQTFSSYGIFADGPLNFSGEAINFNQGEYYDTSGITYNNCFKEFFLSMYGYGGSKSVDLSNFYGVAKFHVIQDVRDVCDYVRLYISVPSEITIADDYIDGAYITNHDNTITIEMCGPSNYLSYDLIIDTNMRIATITKIASNW